MKYQPKDFSSLLGMHDFSDPLLNDHFGLYQSYVAHTNELLEKLARGTRSDEGSEGELDGGDNQDGNDTYGIASGFSSKPACTVHVLSQTSLLLYLFPAARAVPAPPRTHSS